MKNSVAFFQLIALDLFMLTTNAQKDSINLGTLQSEFDYPYTHTHKLQSTLVENSTILDLDRLDTSRRYRTLSLKLTKMRAF